ncbi:MAG: hypothetical protein OEY81_02970 [Candidatus Bathyarchaeota archaeon]|nr:hypothetical protein [Candidatus Bathyarchaeota archaeon]
MGDINQFDDVLTKEFLEREYIQKQKNDYLIAFEVGCGKSTVHRYRSRFGIAARNQGLVVHLSRKNTFNLTRETKDYIDGLLLGDGCLVSQSKFSARLTQDFSIKREQWANEIESYFQRVGITSHIVKKVRENRVTRDCFIRGGKAVRLTTLNYEEFHVFWERWYNEKKFIPHDINVLSPWLLANWYMGDGSRATHGGITMCTNSFSKEDLVFLVEQLKSALGFKFTIHKRAMLYLKKRYVDLFLEYIAPFKVSCFNYKWS